MLFCFCLTFPFQCCSKPYPSWWKIGKLLLCLNLHLKIVTVVKHDFTNFVRFSIYGEKETIKDVKSVVDDLCNRLRLNLFALCYQMIKDNKTFHLDHGLSVQFTAVFELCNLSDFKTPKMNSCNYIVRKISLRPFQIWKQYGPTTNRSLVIAV